MRQGGLVWFGGFPGFRFGWLVDGPKDRTVICIYGENGGATVTRGLGRKWARVLADWQRGGGVAACPYGPNLACVVVEEYPGPRPAPDTG